MSPFKVKRVGFDTIILAVRCRLPDLLSLQLTDGKSRAKDKRSPEPVALGPGQCEGEILPHGVEGGYDVVFSTGELGEMVQFKTDQKGDKWPIRLKIRASSLLVNGYPGAIDQALERLNKIIQKTDEVRLTEVHVYIDVLTPSSFKLNETQIIRPGRATVQPYEIAGDDHPLVKEIPDPELRRILRGNTLKTVMIGKHGSGSPSIIYNKRDEAALRKNILFFEAYGLEVSDGSWSLWRYEIRFSGKILKHKFRVRDFSQLDQRIQEMSKWATNHIRYVAPGQDAVHPSRRRLDPFWETVQQGALLISAAQPSLLLPTIAQNILDRETADTLEKSALGLIVAREVMRDGTVDDILSRLPMQAEGLVRSRLRESPNRLRENIVRAKARRTSTMRK